MYTINKIGFTARNNQQYIYKQYSKLQDRASFYKKSAH